MKFLSKASERADDLLRAQLSLIGRTNNTVNTLPLRSNVHFKKLCLNKTKIIFNPSWAWSGWPKERCYTMYDSIQPMIFKMCGRKFLYLAWFTSYSVLTKFSFLTINFANFLCKIRVKMHVYQSFIFDSIGYVEE